MTALLVLVLRAEEAKAADEEPPHLEMTFAKTVWNENPVIQVHARDESGLKTLELRWRETDGAEGRLEVDLTGKNYQESIALPIRTDLWPLRLRGILYDTHGNRMSWEGEAYIDRRSPSGEIVIEEDKEFYGEGPKVMVTLEEEHLQAGSLRGEVLLNGEFFCSAAFFREGNSWKGIVDCFQEGTYQITAEAMDQAGNLWQESLGFVVDQTVPEILVNGYQEYYQEECRWEILVLDDWLMEESLCAVLITPGGEEILTWQNGCVCWDGKDAEDGWYECRITAMDRAGNESQRSERFCIHRQGSMFSLEGSCLIEENQLPVVEESIWEFTESGLRELRRGIDYIVKETDTGRIYEMTEGDGIGYQIITEDVSGRRNHPNAVLLAAAGQNVVLDLMEEKNSWQKVIFFVVVFAGPLFLAIKKGR